jgi:aspartyl/glutamyl-tRNA(Asn/Gln) amidotransferase C subunit
MTDFAVSHIARLASLQLTDKETTEAQDNLQRILKYVEQLNQVPMTPEQAQEMGAFHVLTAFMQSHQQGARLRADEGDSQTQSLRLTNPEALAQAPATSGIPGELLFEVPSIIERS